MATVPLSSSTDRLSSRHGGRAARSARRRRRRRARWCRCGIASSAGSMRAASLSSRSLRSVASASAPMSGPLGLAAPRPDVFVGGEIDLDLGARCDDRADVTTLHHGVRLGRQLALALAHHRANLGVPRDDGHGTVDARIADRGRDVLAGDRRRASRRSSSTGCSAASRPSARRPRARSPRAARATSPPGTWRPVSR